MVDRRCCSQLVELRSTGQPGAAGPTGEADSSKRKGRPGAAEVETTAEDIESSRVFQGTPRLERGGDLYSLFIRLVRLSASRRDLSRRGIGGRAFQNCPLAPFFVQFSCCAVEWVERAVESSRRTGLGSQPDVIEAEESLPRCRQCREPGKSHFGQKVGHGINDV